MARQRRLTNLIGLLHCFPANLSHPYTRGVNLIRKSVFVIAGALALALGILGIALPVLPATPFLLLALFCFSQGSRALGARLRNSALYRKYLADDVQTKTMTPRRKISIQIVAGCMMTLSFIFIPHWLVRVILGVCFVFHNWFFIFKIKTRRPDESYRVERESDRP